MGDLILISGENNSGKSVFAEKLIGQMKGKRYYIATMVPCTEDNYIRIEKHKKQREQFGFQTLEVPYCMQDAAVESDSVILLEDVSNLLANNIFEKNTGADYVFRDICNLLGRCRLVVAVTISGIKNNGYDAETSEYISSLNEINRKLFDISTVAITMKDEIPVYQKGENYEFI